MKAILEFDLDDPDDREAHRLALAGADMAGAAETFRSWLRSQEKTGQYPKLETVRKEFFNAFEGLLP